MCLVALGLLVVLLAISKIFQELRVHALEGHRHELTCLLDTIGVGTHGIVTSSVVLLLLSRDEFRV